MSDMHIHRLALNDCYVVVSNNCGEQQSSESVAGREGGKRTCDVSLLPAVPHSLPSLFVCLSLSVSSHKTAETVCETSLTCSCAERPKEPVSGALPTRIFTLFFLLSFVLFPFFFIYFLLFLVLKVSTAVVLNQHP